MQFLLQAHKISFVMYIIFWKYISPRVSHNNEETYILLVHIEWACIRVLLVVCHPSVTFRAYNLFGFHGHELKCFRKPKLVIDHPIPTCCPGLQYMGFKSEFLRFIEVFYCKHSSNISCIFVRNFCFIIQCYMCTGWCCYDGYICTTTVTYISGTLATHI